MLESNSLTYTLVLPKGRIYEVQQYIHYCPMCGRPLSNKAEPSLAPAIETMKEGEQQ